jgi:hypothetical protein
MGLKIILCLDTNIEIIQKSAIAKAIKDGQKQGLEQ